MSSCQSAPPLRYSSITRTTRTTLIFFRASLMPLPLSVSEATRSGRKTDDLVSACDMATQRRLAVQQLATAKIPKMTISGSKTSTKKSILSLNSLSDMRFFFIPPFFVDRMEVDAIRRLRYSLAATERIPTSGRVEAGRGGRDSGGRSVQGQTGSPLSERADRAVCATTLRRYPRPALVFRGGKDNRTLATFCPHVCP